MASVATTERMRIACAHCGLPIRAPVGEMGGLTFCCHACLLVAQIVGSREEGAHAWNLLRLGFGALLAMNIMMLSLLLYSGTVETETIPTFRWVMFGLATPALAILLYPLVTAAIDQCLLKKPGLELLIAGGAITSFTVSAMNTINNEGEVFFDTAIMLPVLVTLGKMIEASAKSRAAGLLQTLESLLPATALRVADGNAAEVPIEKLQPGDILRVRPGERIAVDGFILEGTTIIEEAAFTGEALPQHHCPGDKVLAGTVNGPGSLLVKTEAAGKKVLLQRIISMIHNAWENPSPAERIAERAAHFFIPAVVLVALASLATWALMGNLMQGCLSALSVLVVACPCTMGIATPLATSLAIARAATAGIVVRGGDTMEQLGKTDCIFFDKTGTLTTNQAVLEDIVLFDAAVKEDQLLAILATLESASEHTLARTIMAEAEKRGLTTGLLSEVDISPGLGISGVVNLNGITRRVTAGTPLFVNSVKSLPPGGEPFTAVDVAWDGRVMGRVLLADTIRGDAALAVQALENQQISSVLLSGDRRGIATTIAVQTGIGEVHAPRNPAEKLEAVSAAIAAGKNVAMVGDGVNDAAALAAAQVGIAIGSGIELVRQAGNVAILSDRLMQIPWLISLSRQTRKIIVQNFAWSFGYNAIALGAAAMGLLHPLLAAVAMVISSLTVLANSMRVTRFPN